MLSQLSYRPIVKVTIVIPYPLRESGTIVVEIGGDGWIRTNVPEGPVLQTGGFSRSPTSPRIHFEVSTRGDALTTIRTLHLDCHGLLDGTSQWAL